MFSSLALKAALTAALAAEPAPSPVPAHLAPEVPEQQSVPAASAPAAPAAKGHVRWFLDPGEPRTPLTGAERRELWFKTTIAHPQHIPGAMFSATIDPRGDWGPGAEGFGKRVLSRYSREIVQFSVEQGAAAAMGYEPRYLRCECVGYWNRVKHAVAYNFITLDRNQRKVFNAPRLAGATVSGLAYVSWTPGFDLDSHGAPIVAQQFAMPITGNLLREFLPDVGRLMRYLRKRR